VLQRPSAPISKRRSRFECFPFIVLPYPFGSAGEIANSTQITVPHGNSIYLIELIEFVRHETVILHPGYFFAKKKR